MVGLDVLGVIASVATIISGVGWILDRNSKKFQQLQSQNNTVLAQVSKKIDTLGDTLTEVRLDLPEKYVTKEELMVHIRGEERWHESVDRRLEDIRKEIIFFRDRTHP